MAFPDARTPSTPLRIGTHSGKFHADEVFALATVRIARGEIEVVRTRDPELLAQCDARIDVGRRYDPSNGDFDHHQGDAGSRDNGIQYASFGLIWRELGVEVCGGSERIADELDEDIVAAIDASDNGQDLVDLNFHGVGPYTLGRLVGSYSPLWDADDPDAAERDGFHAALDAAEGILRREIASMQGRLRATGAVRDAIKRSLERDPRVIELDRHLPWKAIVMREAPKALLVVYPRSDDWGLQTVPAEHDSFENRRDLPRSWAGLEGADLQRVTGVQDAVFCHLGRFIAVAKSREGVMRLAQLALEPAKQ